MAHPNIPSGEGSPQESMEQMLQEILKMTGGNANLHVRQLAQRLFVARRATHASPSAEEVAAECVAEAQTFDRVWKAMTATPESSGGKA
jgi:cytochrome P450